MRVHILTALLLVAPLPVAGTLAAQDSTQNNKQSRDTVQQSQQSNSQQYNNNSDTAQGQISEQTVLWRMHRTNQMEIRVGRLAQRNGSSSKVKSFGARLVKDHTASDAKVTALAKQLGITLARNGMDSAMGRENGRYGRRSEGRYGQRNDTTQNQYQRNDTTSNRYNQNQQQSDTMRGRNDTTYRQGNPTYQQGYQRSDSSQGIDSTHRYGQYGQDQGDQDGERLAQLHGDAFDTAFANMMVKGHDRAINMLEQAQSQVQNSQLKSLIASTLPTLRQHLQIAEGLQGASATTTSSRQ